MNTSDFYYDLPEELIAQHPIEHREESRLMILNKKTGKLKHSHFFDVIDYLNEGDCLILNNTKVIPARIYGIKSTGAAVEFLLLKERPDGTWESLAGPGRKAKILDEFVFADGIATAIITEILDNGNRVLKFTYDAPDFLKLLDIIGQTPLPHYIHEELKDKSRYQTVYAKEPGSAAAPTAGLHFTKELLTRIKEKGIGVGYVTLHVGIGTFRPVKEEKIEDHKMHSESYYMPKETAELINNTKKSGGRVICVGTTSCRTVESIASTGEIRECSGDTNIFIYPDYKFKCLDALITNFHLPESTLIMLVSALAGRDNILNAYNAAVKEKYRFFSFGDAMLIGDWSDKDNK